MRRLDFNCEDWAMSPYAPDYVPDRMVLPDFQGQERDCWHLRGRAWRWTVIRSVYPELIKDEEYELFFWAKIDYYSGRGTVCYIELCESYDLSECRTFHITPICQEAVDRSGDWVLYRFCFKALYDQRLVAQITAFEANIAIMQAFPGDEKEEEVTAINHEEDITPFTTFNELPFREYAYLEQRMVQYYRDLLAPYYPCDDIPEISQKEYYDFVEDIYKKIFDKPEEFFPKLYEDDAFPNRFNKNDYGKPDLKRHMKSDQEKIEYLFQLLSDVAKSGEDKEDGLSIKTVLKKKQIEKLEFMGFDLNGNILKHSVYKNVFKAIKYLIRKEKGLWPLMFCWFDDAYPYLEKTFSKHYYKEQYERLTGWLKENGYQIGSHSGLSLDYYKTADDDEKPLGYAIHGDKYNYGFTFEYRPEPRVRYHTEPRIIQFGKMLMNFDELSENTKQLMLIRTKRCDGCGYCIQTDKTGKRPLAAYTLDEGITLCPLYPGFNYVFEMLNPMNVDNIISFLTDMENVIKKN